jgi:hypothetical protein
MALKRKWPKITEFIVPIYGGRVALVKSLKVWKQCVDYLAGPGKEMPTGCGGAHQHFTAPGSSVYLVGVFDGRKSTLVHELAHCTFSVMDHVGIPTPPDEKNEAYCYLLDALFEKLEPKIKGKKS